MCESHVAYGMEEPSHHDDVEREQIPLLNSIISSPPAAVLFMQFSASFAASSASNTSRSSMKAFTRKLLTWLKMPRTYEAFVMEWEATRPDQRLIERTEDDFWLNVRPCND